MTSDPTIPPSGVTTFSETQLSILSARGISQELARAAGVLPVQADADLPAGAPDYWTVENGYLPGLLFHYVSPDGAVEMQLRPDVPVVKEDGEVAKYVFAKGARSVVHAARPEGDDVLLVEGTCQTIAASAYAPDGWAVYGIAGCQSWMKAGIPSAGLAVADGRRVLVVLDADAASNRAVYDAGDRLAGALRMNGATEVRFVRLPAGGKAGLDDVLGGAPEGRRGRLMEGLVTGTLALPKGEKPGMPSRRRPEAKKADRAGGVSPFFADGEGLLVEHLAQDIVDSHPIALTADNKLALYQGGVFGPGDLGVLSEVTERLGDAFRREHASNVEAYMIGQAHLLGWRLPERTTLPLLNLTNGMLDLRTGELLPHSPDYRSTVQFPVAWDPDAKAPTYEAWLEACAGAEQIEDLEESISVMLDPSVTPTKAVFVFGPSRSGKSTILRLMKVVVGAENTSAVSLHQLVANRFMAARVFGKALNISADLSAAHLDDISIFKLMTGDDVVEADPKFGRPFTFVNRALFAFSANELPTVGESSRAYSERIKPFHFARSFAGAEDQSIEDRMMDELPGILVRWVAAYRRRVERGRPLETAAGVRELFDRESDRVRKWFAERLEIVPTEGDTSEGGMTQKEVGVAFKAWAEENGGHQMTVTKVVARLLNLPSVGQTRDSTRNRARVLNVRIRPEQAWGIETNRTSGAEERADRADSNHSALGQVDTYSRPPEESIKTHLAHSGKNLPYLPSPIQPSLAANSVILKAVQRLCPTKPPACTQCGTAQVLVDGHWFACPTCHPRTARTDTPEAP